MCGTLHACVLDVAGAEGLCWIDMNYDGRCREVHVILCVPMSFRSLTHVNAYIPYHKGVHASASVLDLAVLLLASDSIGAPTVDITEVSIAYAEYSLIGNNITGAHAANIVGACIAFAR